MFLFVAYVTYSLSRRQDRLVRLLRRSESALKQSYDDLERRIAEETADLISPCSFRLLLGESRRWNPIDSCMPSLAGQSGTKRIENA